MHTGGGDTLKSSNFAIFRPPWPWSWPWIRSYGILSCITHQPQLHAKCC